MFDDQKVMQNMLQTIEQAITASRAELDSWLEYAYADLKDQKYYGEMDASYPDWHKAESVTGCLFDQKLVTKLSQESIDSVLFFISRNNECGRIIAWLANAPDRSWCGNLNLDDFLFLCEHALLKPDDDCDYQLVSCFKKLDQLDNYTFYLLERFFAKNTSYTRRLVLHTFAYFNRPETVETAKTLWETDDCEFAKLSCLYALKKFPFAKNIFNKYFQEYQARFEIDAEDYRQTHYTELSKDTDEEYES